MYTMRVGMVFVVRPYVHHIYIINYSDKHTSARVAIQISPPNLSEGGSFHSPITNHPLYAFIYMILNEPSVSRLRVIIIQSIHSLLSLEYINA